MGGSPSNEAHPTTSEPGGDDAYRIGRCLGGTVYEAAHPRLPGRYAIKFLRRALAAGPRAVEQFRAEAELVSTLRHPSIAQVVELGAVSDGTPFVVMERLAGRTLEQHLAEVGRVPLPEAVEIVRGIASGLEAANAAGVVHGEVRPDNVFLAEVAGYPRGFVKILDFGVARLWPAQSAAARALGSAAPQYLAPEQPIGSEGELDRSADEFALGAIAYRLIAGVDAFAGEDVIAVLYRVLHELPRPLAERVDCDPRVDAVVRRALAKSPAERFAGPLAFAEALAEAAARRPAPAPVPREERVATPAPAPAAAPAVDADSLSARFFAEGERAQAGLSSDRLAAFDEEDELDDVRTDRIARRRWPLRALVLTLLVVGGGVAWRHGVRLTPSRPWPAPPPESSPPAAADLPPSPQPWAQPIAPVPPPAPVAPARPAGADEPGARAAPDRALQAAEPRARRASGRRTAVRNRPSEDEGPLRGYAWSPRTQRLEPTEDAVLPETPREGAAPTETAAPTAAPAAPTAAPAAPTAAPAAPTAAPAAPAPQPAPGLPGGQPIQLPTLPPPTERPAPVVP
jgi:serine/threonine-protein kinase